MSRGSKAKRHVAVCAALAGAMCLGALFVPEGGALFDAGAGGTTGSQSVVSRLAPAVIAEATEEDTDYLEEWDEEADAEDTSSSEASSSEAAEASSSEAAASTRATQSSAAASSDEAALPRDDAPSEAAASTRAAQSSAAATTDATQASAAASVNAASGTTGTQHIKDETPKTADGELSTVLLLAAAFLLAGVGLLLFAGVRNQRLQARLTEHRGDGKRT